MRQLHKCNSDVTSITSIILLWESFFLPVGKFALHVFVKYFFEGMRGQKCPPSWRAFLPSNTYKSDITRRKIAIFQLLVLAIVWRFSASGFSNFWRFFFITTYHTVKKMTDSTSSTMMDSFGVGNALTASSPPLRPIAVTNPPPAPPVHLPMAHCFTYLAQHKSPIGGIGASRNASTMAAACSKDDRIGTSVPTPATLAGAATNVAGAFGLTGAIGGVRAGRNASTMAATCREDDCIGTAVHHHRNDNCDPHHGGRHGPHDGQCDAGYNCDYDGATPSF
jgi:hypothetical protein